jgi:hypothetical protein
MQDFQFDITKLRDVHFKARFEALLAQAHALRDRGGFVELATQHDVLDQLEAVWKENIARYEQNYAHNREAWKLFRQTLASQKHNISSTAYQALLEQLESIEALLLVEDYTENAKAGPALEKAEKQLDAAIAHRSSREKALSQFRMDLKAAMERIWAEDYESLKTHYQQLKEGNEPVSKLVLDEDKVNTYAQERSKDVNEAIALFSKNKKAKSQIEAFATGYAHRRDLQELLQSLKKKRRSKQISFGILMLIIALLAALAIWFIPPWLEKQETEEAFSRARNIDNWESWSDFIEKYPESPLVDKARERQTLLDYGVIDKLVLPSGDTIRYEGGLDARLPDGIGKASFQNGQVYEGSWRVGHQEGQGSLSYPDGSEFIGSFDNGIRKKGILRTAGGTELSGIWKNGKLTGEGSARWPDGSSYAGAWRDGKFHGFGTFRAGAKSNAYVSGEGWKKGSSYTGDWRNGARQGSGTFTYADGKVFSGEWLQNSPNGRPGTLKWPDGSRFRGNWEKGQIMGDGLFVDRFGNDFNGDWRGTTESITRRLPDGTVERGAFVKGRYVRR